MNQNQSFSFNGDLFSPYSGYFINFVFVLIIIYLAFVIIDFFKEKYLLKEKSAEKDHYLFIVKAMSMLFPYSGFGFVISNIFQMILSQMGDGMRMPLPGQWSNLTFGIILIFTGLGLKALARFLESQKGH